MIDVAQALRARGLLDVARSHADDWNVSLEDLLGRDRYRHVSAARFAFWVELRALGLSYPEIGRLVDRDHTTILSGVLAADGYRRKGGCPRPRWSGELPEIPDLFERCAS